MDGPRYIRDQHGAGIVHLGLGAFHKAHQAAYTDDALAASGGDWRIIGVSLRSEQPSKDLAPQDGLYTLITRDGGGMNARVIGSLAQAIALPHHRKMVLNALCAPTTRIVSMTVTEKGYGIDRQNGAVDLSHSAIKHDLAVHSEPRGAAGLLVWALGQRKSMNIPPFTILCCDNLPNNGKMIRNLLVSFARHTSPGLADFIAAEVAFPSTMVDRITPSTTDATLDLAERLIGYRDNAAVTAEPFRQWVIEDQFPTGRPDWEAGGAIFTEDVSPYEEMKLRMLNGAHSLLAYAGFVCGLEMVRDVMTKPTLVALIERHLHAASATLRPVDSIDFDNYARDIISRFSNPNLAHKTHQIAMDGSQKMPQRIFAPAAHAFQHGTPLGTFAFATAAWLRYTFGRTEAGKRYDIRDPLLKSDRPAPKTAEDMSRRLSTNYDLLPPPLRSNHVWESAVTSRLTIMMNDGIMMAAAQELAGSIEH